MRHKLQRYRNTIWRLRKQLRTTLANTKQDSINGLCKSAAKYLDPKILAFFESQMKLGTICKKGRRYSDAERKFALALYYQSPRAYKFLSKLFRLPCVGMLHLWLRKINIKAVWNHASLMLMQNKAKKMRDSDKLCGIVFDAVHLQEHLSYNSVTDTVEGTEYLGELGTSNKVANYAIVFMVRGLRRKWKQLVGHFFYKGALKTSTLKAMLISAVQRVQQTGFIVKFVTCDQDGSNRALFKALQMTHEKPVFSVDNVDIHWFNDAPHLLKSVRNNLRKYDAKVAEKTVSWRHVRGFYEKDKNQGIKLAPKLTDPHIEKRGYSDMKVKFAAQIFSRTVAAGVYTHASLRILPSEAVYTGEFLQNMDKLFDSFNSSSRFHSKECRCALSGTSCHIAFLDDMKKYLQSLHFLTPARVQIFCVKGWISNINSLKHLWLQLQNYGMEFLMTRRLNQDPLENLFGVIRSRFGHCEHPTTKGVTTALKTAVTNDLLHPPTTGNCESDVVPYLYMPQVDTDLCNIEISSDDSEEVCDDISDSTLDTVEENAHTYFHGYVCRRFLQRHKCDTCRSILINSNSQFNASENIFLSFKAEKQTADSLFGGLTLASDTVKCCLRHVDLLFQANIDKVKDGRMIGKKLLNLIPKSIYIPLCAPKVSTKFMETYLRLRLLFHYKFKSKAMRDEARKKTRKIMKLVV